MDETAGDGGRGARSAKLNAGASEDIRRSIQEKTRQIDGRRENTEKGDGPPIRIFNIYCKLMGRSLLSEMLFVEISGDMFEYTIMDYLEWLVHTPIPVNCTHDLKPRGHKDSNVVKVVIGSTLSKYVKKNNSIYLAIVPSAPRLC